MPSKGLFFTFLLSCFLRLTTGWVVGQAVETTSGTVIGQRNKEHPELSEYLGIRFAESTGGKNRFMAPKRFSSKEKFNATACPQAATGIIASFILPYTSEDCLFLNIWTKPEAGRKKPVLLWIYGGAFQMGGAPDPLENGASLSNSQDIIVVNFGYRLNVFGFPGAPGLKHANPGLLDQRLAVEWVRDNIAAFGGDPSRMVLGGASSGGMATDAHSFAWKSDPIVSGFLIMSGTATVTSFFKPAAESHIEWENLVRKFNCPNVGDSGIECVQSKTVLEIQSTVEPWIGGPVERSIIPPFRPIADGKTVFSPTAFNELGKSGGFSKLPVLVGNNYNESLLWKWSYNANDTLLSDIQNNFHCGSAESARMRHQSGVPVWRYLFAGNYPWSTTGATHGTEGQYIFGNGDKGLHTVFKSAIGNFVKDPVNGLTWPRYNPSSQTLARIGYNGKAAIDFVNPEIYDEGCPRFLAAKVGTKGPRS